MAVVTALPGLRLWPLWFLAALQATCVYGAKLSSEACRELGFSSNLLCSSCNLLGQFSLSQLDPFCRDCCQEEAQLETRKHQTLCVKRDLVEYTYNVDFLAQLACLMDISDKLNAVIVTLQDSDTKHARENSMLVLFLKFVDENWEGSLKFREPYSVLVFPKNGSVIDFNGTYSKIKHNVSCFAFVRSDKPKLFRGLQIKYVRGSDPVLKLLDDSGNIAEELSILKWNTDSVEEFLSEKLERI